MGFFKRLLGVERLENKTERELEQIKKNLKTSWSWVNYLHELEQENRTRIKKLEDENAELKELVKKDAVIEVPQKKEVKKAQKVPKQKKSDLSFKEIDISGVGKKEAYVLQILYQLACFDGSSSIKTSDIFSHLPYQITNRGLRKKLYKLEEQGLINSVKYGNTRKWFLYMDKLSKLKQFLVQRTA